METSLLKVLTNHVLSFDLLILLFVFIRHGHSILDCKITVNWKMYFSRSKLDLKWKTDSMIFLRFWNNKFVTLIFRDVMLEIVIIHL